MLSVAAFDPRDEFSKLAQKRSEARKTIRPTARLSLPSLVILCQATTPTIRPENGKLEESAKFALDSTAEADKNCQR